VQHFVRPGITEPWPGKIAKRIGTRSPALHSTFYFRRKSRRSVSFLMLPTSKTEEVSQNCFIFDVVKFKKLEKRPLDSPGPYGTGPREPLQALRTSTGHGPTDLRAHGRSPEREGHTKSYKIRSREYANENDDHDHDDDDCDGDGDDDDGDDDDGGDDDDDSDGDSEDVNNVAEDDVEDDEVQSDDVEDDEVQGDDVKDDESPD